MRLRQFAIISNVLHFFWSHISGPMIYARHYTPYEYTPTYFSHNKRIILIISPTIQYILVNLSIIFFNKKKIYDNNNNNKIFTRTCLIPESHPKILCIFSMLLFRRHHSDIIASNVIIHTHTHTQSRSVRIKTIQDRSVQIR